MTAGERIAYPGDPDLDCHLAGLRLAEVITVDSDEHSIEAVLEFDTSDAGGWWIDSVTGRQEHIGAVTSLSSCFGYKADSATTDLAQWQLDVLRAWQKYGTLLEMTSAPGKWTRLHGHGLTVVIPSASEPARLSDG